MGKWISGGKNWIGASVEKKDRPTKIINHIDDKMVTIKFSMLRCPFCNSIKTPTYKTNGNIRYHLCNDCGKSFKAEWV